jgi:hypothetical protein
MGAAPNVPSVRTVCVFTTAGLKNDSVKGVEAPVVIAVLPAPPTAVMAYCLPTGLGGVSADKVYVGDVNPVCAVPFKGLEGDQDMVKSSKGLFKTVT